MSTFFTSNKWSYPKIEKQMKLLKPFAICRQTSKANPAQFEWIWAGVAALISRQIAIFDFFF